MDTIEIKTLVDITNTQIVRLNQGSQLQIDQHRNFVTLTQCIELRSIVHYDQGPVCEKADVKALKFGSSYKGKQLVWTFTFTTDRKGVYLSKEDDYLGLLIEDLHGVPVVKKLTESINIDKAVFDLKDPIYKNTVVKLLGQDLGDV